jgi:transcriptional regulator with XRE-family HTH domain
VDTIKYKRIMWLVARPPILGGLRYHQFTGGIHFTRSAFWEKLFAARQQMGFSQMQLAEKLAITQSTYAGWEGRTTALKPEYIFKIAAVLNVSVDYLLGHENGGQRKGGPVGKARRTSETQVLKNKKRVIRGTRSRDTMKKRRRQLFYTLVPIPLRDAIIS